MALFQSCMMKMYLLNSVRDVNSMKGLLKIPISTWKSNIGLMEEPLMVIIQSDMLGSLVKIGLMTVTRPISGVSTTKAICMILANVAPCLNKQNRCRLSLLPLR